jgi:hypothetical protein
MVIGLVIAAAMFGALERIWLLAHLPLFGDEAVVGLMARDIGRGHLTTFYWAQNYGGVEPYVVFAVGHVVSGPIGLNATAAVLSGVAAVLVGLVVTELCGDRRAGWLAGGLAWVWPYTLVWNSSRELGFHFVTLVAGLALFYLAVRVAHGHRGASTYLLVGVSAGVGWWSSPEIIYFAVQAAVVLIGSWGRWSNRLRGRWDPRPVILVVGGAVVGALPWLYTNLNTGFVSLSTSSAPVGTPTNYGGRLAVFFDTVMPTELGLKSLFTGEWIGGVTLGRALYTVALLVLAGSVVVAWRALHGGAAGIPLFSCSLAVVAFPFLFAVNPGAGYWSDGRYGVDLSFLLVILVFGSIAQLLVGRAAAPPVGTPAPRAAASSRRARQVACRVAVIGSVALVAGAALTAVGSHHTSNTPDTSATAFLSGWHDPNGPIQAAAHAMEAAGIHYAFADYWTAYDLDLLDPNVTVSPSPLDPVRSKPIAAAVTRAPRPAWIFFAPDRIAQAALAFSNPQQGPASYSEGAFLALLAQRHVGSRTVHLGVLDAVIPSSRVVLPQG